MSSRSILRNLSLILSVALLATGCGKSESDAAGEKSADGTTDVQPETDDTSPTGTIPSNDYSEKVKIKSPDGIQMLEIKVGTQTKIAIGPEGNQQELRGEMRENGKRKYEMVGGEVLAEVKADADAFKVRAPDGSLHWKVKITEEKIKISDNEENEHPYEIKLKGDDLKVERDGTEIGKVKFYAERGKIKIRDADGKELFESNTEKKSAMFALLLMTQIPETDRYIIMAELLDRGR